MSSKDGDKVIETEVIEESTTAETTTEDSGKTVVEESEVIESETSGEDTSKGSESEVKHIIFDTTTYSDEFTKFLQEFDVDLTGYIALLQRNYPNAKVDFMFLNQKATSVINEYFLIRGKSNRFSVVTSLQQTAEGSRIAADLAPLNRESFELLKEVNEDMDMYSWDDQNGMIQYPVDTVILTRDEYDHVNELIQGSAKDNRAVVIRTIHAGQDHIKQLIHGNIKYRI